MFQDICERNGVKLFLNDAHITKDNGYAMLNEVHLGCNYSNVHIYMAVAFHEFGHAIINIKRIRGVKRYNVNSAFYEEWLAWSLAQRFYTKYFKRPFTKNMGNFILTCLKTHSRSHYAFKDIYGDEA